MTEPKTPIELAVEALKEPLTPIEIALSDVWEERERQDKKWGQQDHPDGTGRPGSKELADYYRKVCSANSEGGDNWQDILTEEVFEAFAETEKAKLRNELVQVAAVATAWIEKIDREYYALYPAHSPE